MEHNKKGFSKNCMLTIGIFKVNKQLNCQSNILVTYEYAKPRLIITGKSEIVKDNLIINYIEIRMLQCCGDPRRLALVAESNGHQKTIME